MKLYGRTTSFNVQKVLWLLDELGLEYTHIELPQRVSKWYKVLQQRASYQKWVMSDFTELKAREDY
ncbi:hypothetical protein CWB99_05700 [Pseudoalteromonas rubra]|uniref:GST N-terminal domain-containing protein n=1 Tax=Pseudoalteromonas rubra TaxID=43658 RepID=A0A5S3WPY1_9GAMM|nr:glutathione S-transferase N-terminal domain-containing protein [Pseudoalteromonas rubra]TMP30828.1 hypothetical protein CWB99_05700 [Pseudoalteromonas rubra]TMP34195.1 hypothetical protein CWC00_08525 [Pseudoalteromonas rubra]